MLYIKEHANSDVATPPAFRRAVYVGEDGQLRVMSSGRSIQILGEGGGGAVQGALALLPTIADPNGLDYESVGETVPDAGRVKLFCDSAGKIWSLRSDGVTVPASVPGPQGVPGVQGVPGPQGAAGAVLSRRFVMFMNPLSIGVTDLVASYGGAPALPLNADGVVFELLLVCVDAGGEHGYGQWDVIQVSLASGAYDMDEPFSIHLKVDTQWRLMVRYAPFVYDATTMVRQGVTLSRWGLLVRAVY